MEQFLTVAPVASIIFVITIVLSLMAFSNENLRGELMLHPYSVAKGEKLWTIITSGFIHNDWAHLLFNMFTYFFFAFQLETIIGHWQFGLLYMASLILSDLPTIGKHKEDFWYRSLGASGAISAVLFSYILYNPKTLIQIFPIPFGIWAIAYGILFLIYSAYASKQSRDTINHDAHFFGALSGLMITILLDHSVVSTFMRQLGF
jgi:membrane associated rhomboid family serine protease